MDVALERLPNAVAKVSVTISADDVRKAMDQAFKTVVTRYNIPGFRKGKAPRKIFEMYVGRGVLLQEAAQQLVDQHYGEALRQAAVEPVGQPRIDITNLSEDEPFQFAIEVESKPAITVGPLDELLQEPLSVPEPTEEQIQKELEQLAKTQAELVPVEDEPVQMGDIVTLQLKGYLDEEGEEAEPFAEDDEYRLEVGSGVAVEGLETQLIGLKRLEPTTIRLTYPDSHPDVQLAGKPARFEVTVTEIKRPNIPAINDDLAKTLGFENEQELRTSAANRVKARLEVEAKNDRLAKILGKLKEQLSFELPPSLVHYQIHRQLEELDGMLRQMGATLEDYLESRQMSQEALEVEMRPQAEERVKEQLILEAIARENNVSLSDQDIVGAVKPLADMNQTPLEDMLRILQQRGNLGEIARDIWLAKAGSFLANTVKDPQKSHDEEAEA